MLTINSGCMNVNMLKDNILILHFTVSYHENYIEDNFGRRSGCILMIELPSPSRYLHIQISCKYYGLGKKFSLVIYIIVSITLFLKNNDFSKFFLT